MKQKTYRHIKLNKRHGFTLAELLIVVAIIAVLVAIAIPVFTSQLEKSREATDLANVRAAYAEMMTAAMSEDSAATFNGTAIRNGEIYKVVVEPLKQSKDGWTTNVEGLSIGGVDSEDWKGTPKAAGRCTLTYDPSDDSVAIDWGGNDLSTAAGRRQEDIDNINAIEAAFKKAFENGEFKFYKNFNQITVYSDGDGNIKDYRAFVDTNGYESEADREAVRQKMVSLVESTGIKIDKWQVYSTDEKWKYGYTIDIQKDGTVSVYANGKNAKSTDGGYWYKPNYITEDDRK